jgi:hypothetical protein
MITIQVQNKVYIWLEVNLHFKEYSNYLTHTDWCSYKMERLLFISGLKYNNIDSVIGEYEIYMYNILDFDRYIRILKLKWSEHTFTYDRKEVIEFFDKVNK